MVGVDGDAPIVDDDAHDVDPSGTVPARQPPQRSLLGGVDASEGVATGRHGLDFDEDPATGAIRHDEVGLAERVTGVRGQDPVAPAPVCGHHDPFSEGAERPAPDRG